MAASAIGAGVGLVGSMMQKSSADKASSRAAAAAAFNPWNTSGGLFGDAFFQNGRATFQQNPLTSGISSAISPQLLQLLSGQGAGSTLASGLQGMSGEDIGDAYGAAQGFGGVDPNFLAALTRQGQYGGARMSQAGNALFGAGLSGLGGDPAAMEQMQFGRDFLGATPQSYDSVAAERLGLLREQAAPFEERATDSLMGRLFGQGRLGSTGGGRDIEAFARGLSQADTSRQLDAQGFAEQLYGRDLSASLQQQQMGAGLFSGGLQNLLSSRQQGAGFLGAAGNLYGASAGMYGDVLNAQTGMNQFDYSRVQDRLQRAQDVFGFGSALEGQDLSQAQGLMGILSGLSAEQRQQLGLGADMGKAGAAAGATQAGYINQQGSSPFGGFLSGIGQGMMTGNISMPWGGGTMSTGMNQSMPGGFSGTGLPTSNILNPNYNPFGG